LLSPEAMPSLRTVAPLLVTLSALVGCVTGGLDDDDGVGTKQGNMRASSDAGDTGDNTQPCHPGMPGCDDAGQPPSDGGQPPQDAPSCSWTIDTCSMGPCNGHDGSNEAECYAEGNTGGCSPEVFKAWCTRRVPGSTLWDDIHEQWVKNQCGASSATLVENTFSARNEAKCVECRCTTPLVLSFDGAPVSLRADDGASHFDLSSRQDGSATRTDWPVQPWLALDRDGDGVISSGRELFGSATALGSGTASNGFQALAALDDNGDGVVDVRDSAYARLRLWTDTDGDRVSTAGELRSLADAGVESLQLHYVVSPRCDARGNCEVERATFRWNDAAGQAHVGALVDVHLAVR